MIRAITGMPGSGKSYFLVYIADRELKKGRKVYSNISIKGTIKISFDDLINYTFPHDSVLLIDEAGRDFNSRRWKELPNEIFDLFTLHRHLGLDMYIAAQNFGYIDAQLRRVIELTYWAKNSPILPFHRYEGYYDLEKLGAMKNPDTSMIVWKSRRVRSRYNHTTMSKVFKDKQEIPSEYWFPYGYEYKTLYKVLVQKLRIKYKRWKFTRAYQEKMYNKMVEPWEKMDGDKL